MQTISTQTQAEIEASDQSVSPRILAEWLNSRALTGVSGFSSSDNYYDKTLELMESTTSGIYLPLSETKYVEQIIADGPVGYWKLEEQQNVQHIDVISLINTGTLPVGSVYQTGTTDPAGRCIDFTGAANSWLSITNPALDLYRSLGDMTLEAWIRPDTRDTDLQTIISKGTPTGYTISSGKDDFEYRLSLYNGHIRFQLYSQNTIADPCYLSTEGFPDLQADVITYGGVWNHVVAVYDGSNLFIYINGILKASKFIGQEIINSKFSSSGSFRIGSIEDQGTTITESLFDGRIDEVAVYGKPLSPDTIAQHYFLGTYQFKDHSKYHLTGTAAGTPSIGGRHNRVGCLLDKETSGGNTATVSSRTFSHTIGSGSNRALYVEFAFEVASGTPLTITSVTYNAVNMTRATGTSATEASVTNQTEIYYMLESQLPATGAYNVIITLSGTAAEISAYAISYSNVLQSAPEAISGTTLTDQDYFGTTITPTKKDGIIIDVITGPTVGTINVDTGQLKNIGLGATAMTAGVSTRLFSTATTQRMTWHNASSTQARWAQSIICFYPIADTVFSTKFDGTDDVVSSASWTLSFTDNYVVECWALLSAHPGNTIRKTIVGKGTTTTVADISYGIDFLGTGASTTVINGYACTNTAGGTRFSISSSSIALDTWYHCVLVVRSGKLYFYMNGVSQGAEQTLTGTHNTTGVVKIGAIGTTAAQFLNGCVSDVAIYNSVVMWQDQVLPRYTSGIVKNFLDQGHFAIDELVNGRYTIGNKWFHSGGKTDKNIALSFSNKYVLPESTTQEKSYKFEYGWMGNQISDSSGNFAVSEVCVVNFDQIIADKVKMCIPTDFGPIETYTLYYLNSSDVWTQIGGTWEMPFGETCIEHYTGSPLTMKGLEVRVLSTYYGTDRARICELSPLTVEDISVDVVSINIEKIKEEYDSSVPFGATAANSCSLVLQDITLKYNPYNSASSIYGYMTQDVPLKIALGWNNSGGSTGLSLAGASGDYVSAPDTTHLSITGDLDIRAEISMTDWTPASIQTVVSKWTATGNQRSYMLQVLTDGKLRLAFSTNGTTVTNKDSTVATGITDGARKFIRATIDVDNGAAGYDVRFYTSADGVSWTQLGTTVTTGTATSIFNSTAILEIGSNAVGTVERFIGTIYSVQIRNGIAGWIVADVDFVSIPQNHTATVLRDEINVYTLNGTADLVSGGTEYIPQGTFFVDTWQVGSSNMTTDVQCRDRSKFFQEGTEDIGILIKNATAQEMFRRIAEQAGVESNKIITYDTYSRAIENSEPILYWDFAQTAIQNNGVSLSIPDGYTEGAVLSTAPYAFVNWPTTSITTSFWARSGQHPRANSTAITQASRTSGSSSVNGSSFTTASVTPAASKFMMFAVYSSHGTAALEPTGITGWGMTFTNYGTVATPNGLGRITLFVAYTGTSPSTGTASIQFSGSHTGCAWSVFELTGVDMNYTLPTSSIAQMQSNSATSGTSLTVTLGTFEANSNNATIGIFGHAAATGTAFGSGFTEIHDVTHTLPSIGFETEFKATADTGVDASWTTSSQNCGMALEVRMSGYSTILNYAVSGTVDEFSIQMKANGNIRCKINGTTGIDQPTTLNDTRWHLLTVTWSAGSLVVYQDGEQIGTETLSSGTMTQGGILTMGTGLSAYPSTLGTNWWAGQLDDIIIFSTVKTDMGELACRLLTGFETGCVAYYPMNEGSGTELNSFGLLNKLTSTGIGNDVPFSWVLTSVQSLQDTRGLINGTVQGLATNGQVLPATWPPVDPDYTEFTTDYGEFGLDSPIISEDHFAWDLVEDAYILVPNHSRLDFTNTFSVETWLYRTATPADAANTSVIINKSTSGSPTTGTYRIGFDNNNKIYIEKIGTEILLSTSTLSLNTWTHVVISINNKVVSIYFNGVLDATVTLAGDFTVNNDPLIAFSNEVEDNGEFKAKMASLAIWNRALSATEAFEHYENSLTPYQKRYSALWVSNETLWDGMLQIALADLGMFSFYEDDTFKYESAFTYYNSIFPQHTVSQWDFDDNINIIDGTQLVELLVNKVVVKINPVSINQSLIDSLWTAEENESLAATTLTSILYGYNSGDTAFLTYETKTNNAGEIQPVFLDSGYIKIGGEIIKYDSKHGFKLSGLTRGQFGTSIQTHQSGAFIGETRLYELEWTTSPVIFVKYPFITAEIFDQTVDVDLWEYSTTGGKLVISLNNKFGPDNLYQVLQGENPLNSLDNFLAIAGLPAEIDTSKGKISEVSTDYKEKIRKYGIKDIVIENPFIQDINWAKQIADFVLLHYDTIVPVLEMTTIGIPHLQLGDRITVVSFDQMSIVNKDYWIESINIDYDGGIDQSVKLREAL